MKTFILAFVFVCLSTAAELDPPELDPNNPNNWTSTELKDKLASLGIKISENFTNKQLRRIFFDNNKNSPENSDSGNTETTNTGATLNASLASNVEDDIILSSSNTQNSELSGQIPSASSSRMNTVEPTPLPVVGASVHHNNAFPPGADLNTLEYVLVNNTLQLCQQVIAGVPKQTNKYNLHSAMNFNPGPGSTFPVNQNTFGVQNPTLGEFVNPNQMNLPNSVGPQVPIFAMQTQQVQMSKHGYPATAFSGVDMVSPEIRKIISEHNIKIDWSRGDLELRQMVCAGSTVNMCNFCSSTLHKSSMCPNSRGYQNSKIQPPYQDKYGRDILVHDGMQICNNFNQPKGCIKPYCRHAHVCKICKKTHGKFECSTNKAMPGTQKQEQNKLFPARQLNTKSK
ncbi:unnamed protein product [Mytilus coruscus]|uniref:Uncharacterized protein n=1 Tax=Mytilus coruscus TaxID=42192 RepID=A0A6J8DXJ4_MYTCO|nr:unnamed protein product [Mytilus coruscus]